MNAVIVTVFFHSLVQASFYFLNYVIKNSQRERSPFSGGVMCGENVRFSTEN